MTKQNGFRFVHFLEPSNRDVAIQPIHVAMVRYRSANRTDIFMTYGGRVTVSGTYDQTMSALQYPDRGAP